MRLVYRNRSLGSEALQASVCQRGSALVWALFFVALTAGLLIAHSVEMQSSRRDMDVRYRQKSLAATIAASGLTDATAWFRRQVAQPVQQFAPQYEPAADPPLLDTIDPTRGLVREFEVRGGLWGRYEVRKDESIDVSKQYHSAPGTVWDIGARGVLYEQVDPRLPFDQPPNRIVAMRSIRTEVRGVPVALPAEGALVAPDSRNISVSNGAKVLGTVSSPAVVCLASSPLLGLLATVAGTPDSTAIGAMDLSVEGVFGVREDKLRSLADFVVTDAKPLLRNPPEDKLVFVDGDLDLQPNQSLHGRMAMLVKGDLHARINNDSDFAGMVYVAGNADINGPFHLHGTLIARNLVTVDGLGGPVIIEHDQKQVASVVSSLKQYRKSNEIRPSGKSGAFTDADSFNASDNR
jgi:hypothetical protein